MRKIECLQILERMAIQSQGQIWDEYEVCHYVENLEPLGWDRVYDALRALRKSARRLPTVAEIEKELGAVTVSNEQAIDNRTAELVEHILTVCNRHGSDFERLALPDLSQIEIAAVRRVGGWKSLGEWDEYNATARKRELTAAVRAELTRPAWEGKMLQIENNARRLLPGADLN